MNFDYQLYESGLSAHGCWEKFDEYDREALERFAGRIADEVAAIIEKRTIERCESVLMQLHKKHMRNHNHFHYAALQVAAIRKLGEQE